MSEDRVCWDPLVFPVPYPASQVHANVHPLTDTSRKVIVKIDDNVAVIHSYCPDDAPQIMRKAVAAKLRV